MIKAVYYWEMAPDADLEAFEKWYYDVHVEEVRRFPGVKKYVVSKAITVEEGAPAAPGMRVYRTAELYFDSIDDMPKRLKRIPPISDVTAYGAVNLRRVYFITEDVPPIPPS